MISQNNNDKVHGYYPRWLFRNDIPTYTYLYSMGTNVEWVVCVSVTSANLLPRGKTQYQNSENSLGNLFALIELYSFWIHANLNCELGIIWKGVQIFKYGIQFEKYWSSRSWTAGI